LFQNAPNHLAEASSPRVGARVLAPPTPAGLGEPGCLEAAKFDHFELLSAFRRNSVSQTGRIAAMTKALGTADLKRVRQWVVALGG
jgi:hypothetical protein